VQQNKKLNIKAVQCVLFLLFIQMATSLPSYLLSNTFRSLTTFTNKYTITLLDTDGH